MTAPVPRFGLPLGGRPHIIACGPTSHGLRGRERYVLEFWSLHLYHSYPPGSFVRVDAVARGTRVTPAGPNLPMPISNGWVSLFPPGCTLTYQFAGRSTHNFVNFRVPRAAAPTRDVPAMRDLAERFATLNQSLEECFAMFARSRLRAEVRLWDLLWRLAEPEPDGPWRDPSLPPALRRALELVELRLCDPIDVRMLAAEVGVSHSQLLRLFHAGVGATVVAYVRSRRVERARHLLKYSTLPIKDIAARVGLPDLHHFNKTVRKETGRAPSALRR